MARPEGRVHRGRFLRLDPHDPDLRPERLHVSSDARDEPPSPDRDEDRTRALGRLAQDLHRHRPLPRDDVGIVEGVHVHAPRPIRYPARVGVRFVEGQPVRDHLGSEPPHRLYLDCGRRLRHDDEGLDPQAPRGERHPLRVVAGRGGDDSARRVRLVDPDHPVVCAPHLEREHGLGVLALEQHPVAETLGEQRHLRERRLPDDLVDPRFEDAFEVARGHGSCWHRKMGAGMIRHFPTAGRGRTAGAARPEG